MPAGKREGARPYRPGKTKPLPGVTGRERKVNKSPSARQYPSRETVRRQDQALDRSLTVMSMLPVGGAAVRGARLASAAVKGARAGKQMMRVSKPASNVRVISSGRSIPTKKRVSSAEIAVQGGRNMSNASRMNVEKMLNNPRAKVTIRNGQAKVSYSRKEVSRQAAEREKRAFEKRAAAGVKGDRAPRSAKEIRKDWKKNKSDMKKRSADKYGGK